MSRRSNREDRDTEQQDRAEDLADRAAESVDRRYDATKELHLDDAVRDRPDEGDD